MNTHLADTKAAVQRPQNGIDCAAVWNKSKPTARSKLLKDAGYVATNHYSYRAWMFIPQSVREDVSAVIKHLKRAAAASKTTPSKSSEPRKPMWYDDI